MHSSNALNTTKAYDHAWGVFSKWCADSGSCALPASWQTVMDFATWSLYERERRYRLETVKLTLSAIRARHLQAGLPCPASEQVGMLIRNAARDLREARGGKQAFTPALLRRVCSSLSHGSTIAIRDRAMFLTQFAAGWRCGEVTGLQLSDVRFTRKGFILKLGASKSDQDGSEGRVVGIEHGERELTCPVRALRAWIEVRKRWEGPLFCHVDRHGGIRHHGLIGDAINERLKQALCALGMDPSRYGSHSLRSGMVTTSIERGASESLVMLRTGHKSLAGMRPYLRSARAFRANPLAGVL